MKIQELDLGTLAQMITCESINPKKRIHLLEEQIICRADMIERLEHFKIKLQKQAISKWQGLGW
jgi:hypothetical protein